MHRPLHRSNILLILGLLLDFVLQRPGQASSITNATYSFVHDDDHSKFVEVILERAVFLDSVLEEFQPNSTDLVGVFPAYHDQRGLFLPEEHATMTVEEFCEDLRNKHRLFLEVSLDNMDLIAQEQAGEETSHFSQTMNDLLTQWNWVEMGGHIPVAGVIINIRSLPSFLASVEPGSISSIQQAEMSELGNAQLPSWIKFENEDFSYEDGMVPDGDPPFSDSHSGRGWTPYKGTTDIQREYLNNWFIFNDTSSFGSSSTYEHETILYEKGFVKSQSYWNSTLPRWYKDCSEWHPDYEKYVIGSLKARDIRREQWYYTYVDVTKDNNNTTTSNCQINAQRGHRSPDWWYSCWAVYGDDSCQLTSNFKAPYNFSWSRLYTCLD